MSVGAIAKKITEIDSSFLEEHFGAEVAKIVKQHGAACTAAAAAALCPGAGPTICMVAQTTLVYTMYLRMNQALGIKLGKNVVKALASAAISNIISNAGSFLLSFVGATVLSIIPVVGNYASALLMFGVSYATVMIAAMCYGKTLLALSKAGSNVESMTEDEIKKAMKSEIDASDLEADMKAYTAAYKKARKDGSLTGEESVVLEDWGVEE